MMKTTLIGLALATTMVFWAPVQADEYTDRQQDYRIEDLEGQVQALEDEVRYLKAEVRQNSKHLDEVLQVLMRLEQRTRR